MAGSKFAETIRETRDEMSPVTPPEEIEGVEEDRCYAKLRGPRQAALMLEVRFADGNGEAFDYGLLGRVRFDPSDGLVLGFAAGTVTIRGKNLRPVFDGIVSHRVTWVGEAPHPETAARDPEASVVTKIEVEG